MVNIITERHRPPNEIVPATESESSIKEEVNRRTYKAGYTDRDGQPKRSRNNGAGKGDVPRKCDYKKYAENYDRIFRKPKNA